MNSLYFDQVAKIAVKKENVIGIYKDGTFYPGDSLITNGDFKVCYSTYYGFTIKGWHFSKKRYSLYPLKIMGEKTQTPFNLDEFSYLKDIPPKVGDYIIFKPGTKNKTVTWCHSTLLLRRLFFGIKQNQTVEETFEPELSGKIDEYIKQAIYNHNFNKNDYSDYVIV